MNALINPRKFEVTVHKVRPMYRPKFYLAAVRQGEKVRLLRCNTRFKTFTAAKTHAEQVYQRWCRLYEAAILALSLPATSQEPEKP